MSGTDLRIQKTYAALTGAFIDLLQIKSFEQITVKELCDNAIVRTATFYNHFNSVEDVISCIEESVDAKILECINNHPNGVTKGIGIIDVISNEILPLIYENREILKILYTSPLQPYWIDYLKANYSKWVSSFKSEYDCRTVPSYYAENLTYLFFFSIIELWVSKPVPETPAEFMKIFHSLFSVPISQLL